MWGYRIIQFPNGAKQLHEVAYDDKGAVIHWTAEPARFVCGKGEPVDEIAMSLARALGDTLRALDDDDWADGRPLPVLMAEDLPGFDA